MKQLPAIVLSVALIGSLGMNYFLYNKYSTKRPVMRIGSDVVTRKEYQDQLDFNYGKQVLNKLAYRKLVQQAADKAGVAATDKDVDARLADIERRNPSLLEAAKQNPAKMEELRADIRSDISFENVRIKDVQISDAELAQFYEKNKNLFALPAQAQTTLVAVANDVDAATAKTLLAEGMKPEVLARQPRMRVVGVGGFQLPPNMPAALAQKLNQTVFHMKVGDVATIPVGQNFLVVRLNNNNQAGVPPLEQVKPLVLRVAKLAKAPSPDETLARLYKAANVSFEMDKYAPYFADMDERVNQLDKTRTADASQRPSPRPGS